MDFYAIFKADLYLLAVRWIVKRLQEIWISPDF